MMSKINPNAKVFWGVCSGIGYLIGQDLYSTIIGLVVGLSASLLAELFG